MGICWWPFSCNYAHYNYLYLIRVLIKIMSGCVHIYLSLSVLAISSFLEISNVVTGCEGKTKVGGIIMFIHFKGG